VLNSNDLDGNGTVIIKLLSWHLPGGTEKYSFRISDVVADFLNRHFLNTIWDVARTLNCWSVVVRRTKDDLYHVFLNANRRLLTSS